ncbi:MAG: Flp pilus assembly complex ATPase component TadA, partial [Candidatus Methylomirabilis sp.]|nr:Flp pilus assembly complex ATPase component TadA [Deltaproteobacteria bacterium]
VKIVDDPDESIPTYYIDKPEWTEEERQILARRDEFISARELQKVRAEPSPDARKKILRDFLKTKLPGLPHLDTLVSYMVNLAIGYGELSWVIDDEQLEDIMVNGMMMPIIVFHRRYGMCSTNLMFRDAKEIYDLSASLYSGPNAETAAILDFTTIDGSRVNLTKEPLATHGPVLTIRKQVTDFYSITELIRFGTLTIDLAALLWLGVDGLRRLRPANIFIVGSIGSGKTTLLNALCMLIPPEERVITVEDTKELNLYSRSNYVSLATSEEQDMDDLLRATLRMRPDRLVVGEIRGKEAITLFNAMNVGNKGLGTMHASTGREAVQRVVGHPMNVPPQLAAGLDLIVVLHKFVINGRPVKRVTEVSEIGGIRESTVLLGPIYTWNPDTDVAESTDVGGTTYVERLAASARVEKMRIMGEIEEKKEVLQYLLDNKIYGSREVFAVLERYHKQKHREAGGYR